MSYELPTVKIGDEVWYVPDHDAFHLDTERSTSGSGVAPLFHFQYTEDDMRGHHRKGDRVVFSGKGNVWRETASGRLMLGDPGFPIAHAGPRRYWKVRVREVYGDGTLGLDIPHPWGGYTVHCPDPNLKAANPAIPGVRYDPQCGNHTWHPLDHSPHGVPGFPPPHGKPEV